MRLISLGLASTNTTVGAFDSNLNKVMHRSLEMAAQGCTLGCFQEQIFSGYPAEDFVQWRTFVASQWEMLRRFAGATRSCRTAFALGVTVEYEGHVYNAAALVHGGRILGVVPKEKLPTYGVFYEGRTFTAGQPGLAGELPSGPDGRPVPFGDLFFEFPFGTVALEVCEDIWSQDGPMRRRAASGAELIINLSASPFRSGVLETRVEMISQRAADNQVTLAYVNQVGGNDALVFDGGCFVNQNGKMLGVGERWKETLTAAVVDLDRTRRLRHENTTWRTDNAAFHKTPQPLPTRLVIDAALQFPDHGEAYPTPASRSFFIPASERGPSPQERYFDDLVEAMVMGLRDYTDKTHAFKRVGIALSGGKDSTLTAVIAWILANRRLKRLSAEEKAAGIRDFIHGFSMPSRHNSDATKDMSRRVAEALGITFREVPITEDFERECAVTLEMMGPNKSLMETTKDNIQARIRGTRMRNWANNAFACFLQTSNMSEKAVGYTTIGGDMQGDYSLIANLPKTVVTQLLIYLGEKYGLPVLVEQAKLHASAELRDDQEDERDLMPFPVLDAAFNLFVAEKLGAVDLYKVLRSMWTDEEFRAMDPAYQTGTLKKWVRKFLTLFFRSIYKWVQTPLSVHLGSLDLDRERALQLPVVQSLEWLHLADLESLD